MDRYLVINGNKNVLENVKIILMINRKKTNKQTTIVKHTLNL